MVTLKYCSSTLWGGYRDDWTFMFVLLIIHIIEEYKCLTCTKSG